MDKRSAELRRRARARLEMGKGGANTYARLGKKPPAPKPKTPPAISPADQKLLDAATRLRFGDEDTSLNEQLGQNTRYSAGVPKWYADARAEIAALQQRGQQTSQQTLQGIQNYNSQPATGAPLDQQAANARNNLNSQYAAAFGQGAQANSDFMDRLAAAMKVQEVNTQGQAGQDRQKLYRAQQSLGQQKGDFKTGYLSDLASGRAKVANEQAKTNLAAQALGLKVDTYENVQKPLAKSLMGDRKAGQKIARSKTRHTKQQDAVKNALGVNKLALDAYKLAHPNSGKGAGSNKTYTKDKVQGFRQNWDYANATAKQLRDRKTYTDKSGKAKPVTYDVAYSALLGATKDPDIAQAAALTAFGKPIPAALRHKLAIKGVHPPKTKPKTTGTDLVNKGIDILQGLAGG